MPTRVASQPIRSRRVGEQVFPIARAAVVLVTDEAIREAQETLWSALRLVAKPGGAAALAAVLSERYRPEPGERVGVVVSGGNTVAVGFGR
jgi:threonine dehydratase